jgi:hypothetical protein
MPDGLRLEDVLWHTNMVVTPDHQWRSTLIFPLKFRNTVGKATPKDNLIVFGRYPTVGATKTRLIPALGPAGAAAAQKRLTEQTLAAARSLTTQKRLRLTFCYDGGDPQRLAAWLDVNGLTCVPQANGDLGQRMLRAMSDGFTRGAERVVLVGTDVPELSAAVMNQAFEQLDSHDLVIGPSTDGGYWLIGMNRPKNIFAGIQWSTPSVLEETLALAGRKGMAIGLLDPLTDLDDPDDLARGIGTGLTKHPYVSVIIPTLNEARQIEQTLAAATCPDAEIIVSDGHSTDRTVDRARAQGARIVVGQRGRAVQQNRGAVAARGDVLLFLHADTRLPENYAAHVFDTLMDRRTVLGAFRFQTDLDTPAMRWISFWTNLRAGRLQLPYGDQALFLYRDRFHAVGGFPEVPIAEDLYLVRRMHRRGRIALAPVAAVTSGRRWRRLGPLRTTLVNTIIALGCLAGVPPQRLAPLYRPSGNRIPP